MMVKNKYTDASTLLIIRWKLTQFSKSLQLKSDITRRLIKPKNVKSLSRKLRNTRYIF